MPTPGKLTSKLLHIGAGDATLVQIQALVMTYGKL